MFGSTLGNAYPSKMDKQDPITTLRWPFPEWEISFIGHTLLWAQEASETYKVLMDRLRNKELSLTDVMQQVQLNVFPLNIDTVNCMLEACIHHESPILGLEVFAAMREDYALVPEKLTIQALVHLTEHVFNAVNTSVLLSERACNVLICIFAEEGYTRQADMLADALYMRGLVAVYDTYSVLFRILEEEGSPEGTKTGWKHFEQLLKNIKDPLETQQWSYILNRLCKDEDCLKKVLRLVRTNQIGDVGILNAMLTLSEGFQTSDVGKQIFSDCQKENMILSAETYEALFKLFFLPNIKEKTAGNDYLSCCTYTAIAFHTFLYGPDQHGTPLFAPSLESFKLIIQGLSRLYPVAAKELFYLMKKSVKPDYETYRILVDSLSANEWPFFAWQLIGDMNADRLCPDNELYCGMIKSLARSHFEILACSLFQGWLGQEIAPTLEFVNELVKSFDKSNMRPGMQQLHIRKITKGYGKWLRKATTFDSEDSSLLVETKSLADMPQQTLGHSN